jgi:hypothetical protein
MTYTLPITNPNPKSGDTRANIYGYVPWLGLGITAVLVFAICLLAHVVYAVLAIRRRKGRATNEKKDKDLCVPPSAIITFEVLFGIGCIFEVIGYAFRTASNSDPYRLVFFIVDYFMIVVVSVCFCEESLDFMFIFRLYWQAPVYFSAALYYCLSILVLYAPACANLLPLSGKAIVRSEYQVSFSAKAISADISIYSRSDSICKLRCHYYNDSDYWSSIDWRQ